MTWNSTSTGTTSSSKSSVLFNLDEEDTSDILVYKYRSGLKNLEITTQKKLCEELDKDPSLPFLRVTKKAIPRRNSRLEILSEDLLLPELQAKYSDKPTLKSSVANVGLPSTARWKHLLFNSFPQLYIVSRSHTPSPNSSTNNSPESSQHVSPSTTIPVDHSGSGNVPRS